MKGLYCDIANGIVKGACGPILIHTDKSKSKEKEAEERVRQHNGESPTETITSSSWKVGLENLPDVKVETTNSGSMMQEVFMVYAKHFVETLPVRHGPVMLFLDGHASHWNKYALKYLMDNHMFTFFLASHMSIWAQPNDAGVNKQFHSAIEEECRQVHHTLKVATKYYFNNNFAKGWRTFLKLEHEDLRLLGVNNATRAFQCTGLFPYNPFAEAWTEAIQTIDQGQKPHAGTQYEIFINENIPTLIESESIILCSGLNLEDSNHKEFHDLEVAKIRGMHILKHWREDILKAVSEGEQYEAYSSILIPSPKTDSEKMAMWLIHFEKIDSKSLCPVNVKKRRESS